MFLFNERKKRKKKIREALKDADLRNALSRASGRHYRKYRQTTSEIPWEEIKEKARAVRQECLPLLPELIRKFSREATKAGASVYEASSPGEALGIVETIASRCNARLIAKSKSMVSEEIGLNEFLETRGYRVVETDLGEWIVQLAGERPSHITAPALHKTKEEVAGLFSRHLGRPVPAETEELVRTAREEMRKIFLEADIGISGANLAIAESGTLVILSNEGNARLVTSLPPVHIALITTEKFVDTMEQALPLIKALVAASSGLKLTSYVSFITGPSRTTDIEKELVIGVHGPREVHIIILDNGRLEAAMDDDLKEILYCLKCGGCMLSCPVFQAVGGYNFGGPVYPGGIGVLLTAVTGAPEDAASLLSLCADCKKCEDFCPVGIPTGDLLIKLKERVGSSPGEKALSFLFRSTRFAESGARILSILQGIWRKNGYLKKLPFRWAGGKRLPALNPRKPLLPGPQAGRKIYLFQGCLVKFFFPDIRDATVKTLVHFGFDVVVPEDQGCCGAPCLHVGRMEDVRKLAAQNLRSFSRENPDHILTVCPTGNSILKKLYPRVDPKADRWSRKIFDFTEFLVRMDLFPEANRDEPGEELYYHFPCHYLNDLKLKDEPPKLLRKMGYDLKIEPEPFACCGFCGVFSFKNPEISARLWEEKKGKILKSSASSIATDCPGCILQLKAGLKKEDDSFRVYHTAELCARAVESPETAAK